MSKAHSNSAVFYTKDDFAKDPSKPAILVNPVNIPDELKERRQWLLWRFKMKDGKRTKVPIRIYEYTAQVDGKARIRKLIQNTDYKNPVNWDTFDNLAFCHEFFPECYPGLGFSIWEEDPYTCIDLDDCRDPISGELTEPAQKIMSLFGSYTEVSPSGTGVKIIIRAKKPGSRCRDSKLHIEIYDKLRWVALTGILADNAIATIEDRQTQLNEFYAELFPDDADTGYVVNLADNASTTAPEHISQSQNRSDLSDDQIIEKAQSARNCDKFTALWAGDYSAYGSRSEADLALAGIIAFWAQGNASQIERMMWQSGLKRHKWQQRQKYLKDTIDRAVKRMTEFYGQQREYDDEFDWATNASISITGKNDGDKSTHPTPTLVFTDEELAGIEQAIIESKAKEAALKERLEKEREAHSAPEETIDCPPRAPCYRIKTRQILESDPHQQGVFFIPCGSWKCDICHHYIRRKWITQADEHFRKHADGKGKFFVGIVTEHEWPAVRKHFERTDTQTNYFRVLLPLGRLLIIASENFDSSNEEITRTVSKREAGKIFADCVNAIDNFATESSKCITAGREWKKLPWEKKKPSGWKLKERLSDDLTPALLGELFRLFEIRTQKPVPIKPACPVAQFRLLYKFRIPRCLSADDQELFLDCLRSACVPWQLAAVGDQRAITWLNEHEDEHSLVASATSCAPSNGELDLESFSCPLSP